MGPFGDLWRPWGSNLDVTLCPVAIWGGGGRSIFVCIFSDLFFVYKIPPPLKIVAQIRRIIDFRGEGPLAPKGGPADSGALTNWLAPHSKIPSAATDPRPERAHPRTERAYPMFEKTILRLRVYLRPDMPISDDDDDDLGLRAHRLLGHMAPITRQMSQT